MRKLIACLLLFPMIALAKAPAIELVTSVDNHSPYVQSQIDYKVQLRYREKLKKALLTHPKASQTILMQVGKDRQFKHKYHGKTYQVIERHYAIFPQNSGKLVIQPPELSAKGKTLIKRKGKPITVSVQAIPPKQNNWLPAKQLRLREQFDHPLVDLKTQEPIVRTVLISARGLTAAQLPDLTKQLQPASIKSYRDKPELRNVTQGRDVIGQRIERIIYLPENTGKFTLPAVKLSWWHTSKDSARSTALAAHHLTIGGIAKPTTESPTPIITKIRSAAWQDLLINGSFIIAGLLLGLFIIRQSKHQIPLTAWRKGLANRWQQNRIIKSIKKASLRRQLHRACAHGYAYKIKRGLMAYAQLQWPHANLRALSDLAKLLQDEAHITQLQQACYGNAEYDKQQGKALWQWLKGWQTTKKKTPMASSLPKLWLTS